MNDTDDKVTLMTIHSAKGLEFKKVFLIGLEEGVFPGNQSIYGGESEIEEERRLMYVAITRAKRELTITNASTRMIFGSTNRNMPSRFLKEIPDEYCNISSSVPKVSQPPLFKTSSRFGESSYGFNGRSTYSHSPYGTSQKEKLFGSYSSSKTAVEPVGSYTVGQRVEHKTFGEGLIVSVSPMGSDTMLEIAFENVGTKKLMATYAKLKVL